MLWQRIISALIGIPIALYVFNLGGIPFLIAIILLSFIGQREMIRILAKGQTIIIQPLVFISGIIFCLSAYYLSVEYLLATFISVIFLLFIHFVFYYPKNDLTDMGINMLVIVYPGLLFSMLILLRNLSDLGFIYIVLAFLITWSSDTFAYFIGRAFGKKKLAPQLSPGKTIEGSVGGLMGCLIILLIFNYFIPVLPFGLAIVLGLGGSALAQIGDLFESGLKRLGQVKDSGNLIPGHGGILDRFDSILFLAPALYFFLLLFGG